MNNNNDYHNMAKEYASKKEHDALTKRVNEGFQKNEESIEKLTNLVSTYFSKSERGDYQTEKSFFKELDRRDTVKKNDTYKVINIVVTLLIALSAALWWGINATADLKILKMDNELIDRIHILENKLSVHETRDCCDKG